MSDTSTQDDGPVPNGFLTTQWSMVTRTAEPEAAGRAALDRLCRAYWFPVYAYARKQGCAESDAEDVTQEFFAEISRTEFLQRADPERGRFRSYLLTAVRRRILNARTRATTEKRGGSVQIFSLDEPTAEERFREVDDPALDPAEAYERSWVLTLLGRVRARLREEQTARGKAGEFELLEPFLGCPPQGDEYVAIAARLGIARGTVAVNIHRLGKRYRDLLRDEVAQTVTDPAETEGELAHLLKVLAR